MIHHEKRALRLRAIAYHRNGVGGRGFYAIAFRDPSVPGKRNMIATVFETDEAEDGAVQPCTGMLAVLDADLAACGMLQAGVNTWRGDLYEPQLRQWIAQHQLAVAAQNAAALAARAAAEPAFATE